MAAVLAAVSVLGCGSGAGGPAARSRGPVTLDGAGTTFAEPAWRDVGDRLRLDFGWIVHYADVSPAEGRRLIRSGQADFSATELGTPGPHGPLQQIPVAVGAIVVAYRLPGIATGLRLDAPTAAAIFAGTITRWDDPRIARHNRTLHLPALPITVIHRSDPSSTTLSFTHWLASGSAAWRTGPGVGEAVRWPTGRGIAGTVALGEAVQATPGAIAPVEQAYALDNDLTYAYPRNKARLWVAPTARSVGAPLHDFPSSRVLPPIIDVPRDPGAYPMTLPAFLVVPRDVCSGGRGTRQGEALRTLVDYALGKGQGIIKQLYAALPEPYLGRAQALARELTCDGRPSPTRYVPVKPPPVA